MCRKCASRVGEELGSFSGQRDWHVEERGGWGRAPDGQSGDQVLVLATALPCCASLKTLQSLSGHMDLH